MKPADVNAPQTAIVSAPANISLLGDPEEMLLAATRAATALKKVLDVKEKVVMIRGERYLEYEDWQTVAHFFGVTARVVDTKFFKFGDVQGFMARAQALLITANPTKVISAAEAMCCTDETYWASRPVFEYVPNEKGKQVRTKVGDAPVPMFQLRSMAQTRACAKALRNVMAWVVVLAGYKPTPAEEMTEERAADRDLPLSLCYECGEDIWDKGLYHESRKLTGRALCQLDLRKFKESSVAKQEAHFSNTVSRPDFVKKSVERVKRNQAAVAEGKSIAEIESLDALQQAR